MTAAFRRAGLSIQVEFARFHRRRIELWGRRGELVEVGLDRGVHGWRKPHSEPGRTALAARRTLEQHILIA
eukprot:7868501-Lingulodinium_polyedra.AAC.1